MHKGDRVIRIITREERAEKEAKLKRHWKAAMLLLADLEPEDYLEIAHKMSSNSLLTERAA